MVQNKNEEPLLRSEMFRVLRGSGFLNMFCQKCSSDLPYEQHTLEEPNVGTELPIGISRE